MSRTAIVAWIMTLVGLLGLVGIDLPVEQIEELLGRITDDVLELYMLISGPLFLWLRKITSSPLAQGIQGWLGFRETTKERKG